MSKQNNASTYEPDARYEVRLLKSVPRGKGTLSPMHRHVLTGKMLADIPTEAIADVKPL